MMKTSTFKPGPAPIASEASSLVNGPFPIKPFTVVWRKVLSILSTTGLKVYSFTPKPVKDFLSVLKGPIVSSSDSVKAYLEKNNVKTKFSKEELSKLGLYALLSYGFVSNFSYITCVIIAWCIHGKTTGLSPLAAGQWRGFLAIYSGLYVANNFLRPARFGKKDM